MTVDFHVHSTASDGTVSPRELAAMAAARGIRCMALTDHDNVDGADEFTSECRRQVVRGLAGIELSIEAGAGFDKFHLLGLGIDPKSKALGDFLVRIREGRDERNRKIFENFHRLGIDIRPEPHGAVLARPHFAKWLVANGYAPDVKAAFAKYLLADSPAATRCYEERFHPAQEASIGVIHAAGGVAVMAHPKYWRNEWRTTGCDFAAAERGLAALREKGLDGVEAVYQANTDEETTRFTEIALRLGYAVTAGSDFHGANKPGITLGMEVPDDFSLPEALR